MGLWNDLFSRNYLQNDAQSQNYQNHLADLEQLKQQRLVQANEIALAREIIARQQEQSRQSTYSPAWQELQAKMAAATPERKVKEKVKKALEDLDVYYTMPFTAGYGNSGVPDFLICIEGKFFGIECKAGRNTTTALQEKHLSDIRAAGGVALVIDETNVDNVKTLILANLGEK